MKMWKVSDTCPNHVEYLEFVNKANTDNEDLVPFDSVQSLKIFFFSSPRYDSRKHYIIWEEESLVADLYIRPFKPGVTEAGINILSEWRDKGLGEKLLSTAIRNSEGRTKTLRIILSPGNIEIIPKAKEKGFTAIKQVDLLHPLETIEPILQPTGYKIRTTGTDKKELENITLLRNQFFTEHRPEELKTLMKGMTNCFVTLHNGEYVGYCIVQRNYRSPKEGFIVEIGVKPDHRKKGIGKSMILMGLDWLRSEGCEEVATSTGSDNIPALKMYTESGFKIVKEKEKILERKF